MKKFLTVLLALSVVFTYTVGTAFAAAPTADKDKLTAEAVTAEINSAYEKAKADLLKAKNDALYTTFEGNASVTIDKTTIPTKAVETVYDAELYKKAFAQAKAEYNTLLNEVQKGINAKADYFYLSDDSGIQTDAKNKKAYPIYVTFTLTDGEGDEADKAAYETIFAKVDNEFHGEIDKVAQETAKLKKQAVLDAIRAIDLDAYSKEYNGNAKSNYALATDLVTAAITAINNLEVTNDTTYNNVFYDTNNIMDKIAEIYTAPINQQKAGGKLYTGGLLNAPYQAVGLNNLPKIADEPTEEAKLDWAQNKVLTTVTAQIDKTVADAKAALIDATIAGEDADTITDLKDAVADAEKFAKAAKEILTYLVNDCDNIAAFIYDSNNNGKFDTSDAIRSGKWNFTATTLTVVVDGTKATFDSATDKVVAKVYSATECKKIVQHVADLKEEAEIYKNAEAIDGAVAEAIDEALEDAIDATYKGDLEAELDLTDIVKLTYNTQKELIGDADTDVVKVNNRKYPAVEAWDKNLTSVYDKAYYDAVRTVMAETKDEIWAATSIADAEAAFLAGYEKLDAVPTVADKNVYQATKEYKDAVAKYTKDIEEYANYKNELDVEDEYSWNHTAMAEKLVADFADAYTAEELKATFEAAKAEIDNLKTEAELVAAKEAIVAKIDALTKDATPEEAKAIRAEVDAYNDYCTLIGDTVNDIKLVAKLVSAEAAVKTAMEDAIKAQYDAIYADYKVTVDEADAVKALREAVDAYFNYYADENMTPDAITELRTDAGEALAAEAEADLNAALIKEFKQMVAQLPADGSDVAGIKAAKDFYEALPLDVKMSVYQGAAYDKLADLQKILIKNVESLKIVKNHSVAGKGYIKIAWSTIGDTSAVDGYQIYRATKANGVYNYMFTTANKTYKNTKSLKKGTRYFYKVRAFVEIDGQKYYSDWSNKAYRVAK